MSDNIKEKVEELKVAVEQKAQSFWTKNKIAIICIGVVIAYLIVRYM